MLRSPPVSLTRLVAVPENRSALLALQRAADDLCSPSGRDRRSPNPLFLHGPSGSGKTYLVLALVEEVGRRCPALVVASLSAADWKPALLAEGPAGGEASLFAVEDLRSCDLVVIEDLQHLSSPLYPALARTFDDLVARQVQMVFTAAAGPGQLSFPRRLASRLGSGLVVGLGTFQRSSRLALLREGAQRRQLAVGRDVLAWLAEHLGGSGRELEGALDTLEALSRVHGLAPDLETVAAHFREQAREGRPTVETILERVGRHFDVDPRRLRSGQRGRNVLLPRQVGMYLARQLTPLSLAQIGACFGGRDHSTVLHACRKVEQALAGDPVLSGTVRQLCAELA